MKAKLIPTVNPERVALQERIPLATPLVIYVEPSGYCNLKVDWKRIDACVRKISLSNTLTGKVLNITRRK